MRDRFRHLDESALPDDMEASGRAVLEAAAQVAKELGLGLRERIYREALAIALREMGHTVSAELPVSVAFRGHDLGEGCRLDLLVDGHVVIEVKSAAEMHPSFETQLLTYMRGARVPLGYVLNFGMPFLSMGIRRKIMSSVL